MDLVSSSLAMNWKTAIRTFLLLLAAFGPLPVLAASSSLEIPCIEFSAAITVDCLCSLNQENATRINCDNVVFPGDFPVLPWPPPGTFSSDLDLLLPEDLELALLQGRWVPFTWTGEVGVAEDPIEESRRDSDLWIDLADPELMEPEPGNIPSINVCFLYL